MLKTHYYGGIKKYQWVNVPLALCGTIFNVKGEKLDINIGSDEKDPVLIIPDLEPHLSHKIQNDKKIREAITGEALNPVAGTLYNPKDKENKLKNYVLNILHKKYGIVEKSLLSAELQLVPAGRSRFSGLDSSLIAGYGHDDRCCAYASLKALTDSSANQKTSICLFYDKEEIGSEGATGAKSKFIEDIVIFLNDIVNRNSTHSSYRKIFLNSNVLSADVNAVVNPNFPEVHELQNAAKIGYGIVVTKFTGSGGKYSANDADAEYLYKLTSAFDRHKVIWQIGELGKVDEGGGGTIAKYIAELGANVIDCGIGVMSMHSPYELISKYDLYSGYKAYAAFLKM
jgi:aspartyl aminopeptidase